MSLLETLQSLPNEWALVAVDGSKRPYQSNWQLNPLDKKSLATEIKEGRAHAIGVLAGPESGGLLFLDHDGPSATTVLTEWGISVASLPPSWAVTSGRPGRWQMIFRVPKKTWPLIRTRKFRSGIKDAAGNVEQIELRWTGCQSVVAGAHPTTGAYAWMSGRSPSDVPFIAEAPPELLEKMMTVEIDLNPPTFNSPPPTVEQAREYLASLNPSRLDDYDSWIQIGMCLHSVSDELLKDWIDLSSKAKGFKPGVCERKWKTFGKRTGVTIGTLIKFAKEDGWKPKANTSSKKPRPLDATDIVDYLRQHNVTVRHNIQTQKIEVNGQPLPIDATCHVHMGERFGVRCTADNAISALKYLGAEDIYDPVREYLDFVYKTVRPDAVIELLASTYLGCSDDLSNLLIKKTLLAAVQRAYDPGCKFDAATVLVGSQGGGKSKFWSILGGPFFSDSLGNLTSKDDILELHKSWICEWGEIDRVTSNPTMAEVSKVKRFLSCSSDSFRMPYERAMITQPRRGIIVGTTNEYQFLVDDSGNRRFWPIQVNISSESPLNADGLMLERDSIWSGAVAAYHSGERAELSREEALQVDSSNENFCVEHPWMNVIRTWLDRPSNRDMPHTISDILAYALEMAPDRMNRRAELEVGKILRKLGFERFTKCTSGRRRKMWRKAMSKPRAARRSVTNGRVPQDLPPIVEESTTQDADCVL